MKLNNSAAILSAVVVGALLTIGLWRPASVATNCVNMLTAAPCEYLGVDLWHVPYGWWVASYHYPALLPLVVAVPVATVVGVTLLVAGRVLNRRPS